MVKKKIIVSLLIGSMLMGTGSSLAYGSELNEINGKQIVQVAENQEEIKEIELQSNENSSPKEGKERNVVSESKFSYVKTNGSIGTLKDSKGVSNKLVNEGAVNLGTSTSIKTLVDSTASTNKDAWLGIEIYRKTSDGKVAYLNRGDFNTNGYKKFRLTLYGLSNSYFENDRYLYIRIGTSVSKESTQYTSEKFYKIDNPSYKGFYDTAGHFAEPTIMKFVKNGWINGYSDKTFKPNKAITRAEFIKVTNKVFGYKNYKKVEKFSDVASADWYYNEINAALNAGYITSNNSKFRPNDLITREEAANIITSIKKCKDSNLNKLNKYTDKNKVSNWAKSSVEGAIEKGYMGQGSKEFRPKDNITRGEAVVTLDRAR